MRNAVSNSGSLIFLAAGKKIERKALKNLDIKGHPTGSTVIMTPSDYMTDVACIQLVPILCKIIRAMPVIYDHEYWWVMMSLNGYYSHSNVH